MWAPVFSSCSTAVIAGKQTATLPYMVFCGSHDHHVYCWEVEDDRFRQVWRTLLDSEVYAVPCVGLMKTSHTACTNDTVSADQPMEGLPVVCVCSSSGWLYLMEAASGSVLGQVELPWDVFSSPVLLPSGRIVVGCRDDSVYCVNVNVMQF